jgi:hypothetical protein
MNMRHLQYVSYLHRYGFLQTQSLAPQPKPATHFHHVPVSKPDLYILQSLGFRLSTLSTTVQNGSPLVSCFLDLIDLGDDFILLVLENTSIDLMFHGLSFEISTRIEIVNNMQRLGLFCMDTKTVTIALSPAVFSTLIHEIAHACTYFTFRRNVTNLPETPPHPPSHPYEFNPAKLKFLRCVNEDKWRLKYGIAEDYLFSPQIDTLFQTPVFIIKVNDLKCALKKYFAQIEYCYEVEINHEAGLNEIFPFYIEIRAKLLKFAKDYGIPKHMAYDTLERYLPKLHQYFETDIKRILQHRLYHSIVLYEMKDFNSLVLSSFFARVKASGPVYKGDVKNLLRDHWTEYLQTATPAINLPPSCSR